MQQVIISYSHILMKKYLFVLLIAVLNIHPGMSQEYTAPAPDKYLISGKLTNVPDGVRIDLCQSNGQLIETVLFDTLTNGMFSFSDTISSPKKLMLTSREKGFPNNLLDVWVAPGKHITIAGQDKLMSVWQVESDIPEQQETNQYQSCARDLRKEMAKHLAAETDCFRQMYGEDGKADEEISKLVWAKVDSIRKLWFPIQTKIYKAEIDCMKTAPISSVWMEKFLFYSRISQMAKTFMPYEAELKELYANMPEALKQTEDGQLAHQYLYPPTTVGIGDEMVDGDLFDCQGNVHRISEFRGKYILLDFWSSGCGPCIESIPEMEEIADTYKDHLVVVGISIDPEKAWKEFVAKKNLKGNQWNELRKGMTGLAARYGVRGYPHYILIAPDGKLQDVWGGYGTGSLMNKVKENLDKVKENLDKE